MAAGAWCQDFTPFASGLQFPQRLIMTPGGNLVVSEGGTQNPNTGRLSIVDKSGTRRSLLEGLPSGLAHFTNPFGPTGMALDGRTLYLLIGEGDVMRGAPPNYGINLDGPSSPIFSSILKVQFSQDPDGIQSSFRLQSPDDWALLDGYDVNLRNATGDGAGVQLLTTFRPLVRNFLGGEERVRPADPYGVALGTDKRALYVARRQLGNDHQSRREHRARPGTGALPATRAFHTARNRLRGFPPRWRLGTSRQA